MAPRGKKAKNNEPKSLEELYAMYTKHSLRFKFSRWPKDYWERQFPVSDPETALARIKTLDRPPSIAENYDPDVIGLLDFTPSIKERAVDHNDDPPIAELVGILNRAAEEIRLVDLPKGVRDLRIASSAHQKFVALHSSEGRRHYVDTLGEPLLVFSTDPNTAWAIQPHGHGEILRGWSGKPLSLEIVYGILRGTWKYGHTRHHAARDCIYEMFAEEIADIKRAAQEELRQATAIKDDGTSLIHVQKVVIINGQATAPRATVFPAEVFSAKKIVIPSQANKIRRHRLESTVENYLESRWFPELVSSYLAKETPRVLLEFSNKKSSATLESSQVLLCHEHALGFPIPVGGYQLLA